MAPFDSMQFVAVLTVLLVSAGLSVPRLIWALHMLQLDSYNNQRLLRWLLNRRVRFFDIKSALVLLALGLSEAAREWITVPWSPMVTLVAWGMVGTFFVVITFRTRPEQKKPLVYTARAKRLIDTSTI